jgi:hypothetical protein
MGETRDHLEEHGGPGMVWCNQAQCYVAERCEDHCAKCMGEQPGGCPDCEAECPEWRPDEPEPADQAEYFDWLGGAIRAGWL